MSIVTVYSTIWNEEVRIPYFINHYRKRFPNCEIVFFDNQSTDKSIKIALDNNCKIVSFSTNNIICDFALQRNKNNCWKSWDIKVNPWESWCDYIWTTKDEINYLNKYPEIKNKIDNGEFNCGMTHYFNIGKNEKKKVPNRLKTSTLECKTDWCIVVDCDEFLEVDENLLSNSNFNIICSNEYDLFGENNDIDSMTHGIPNGSKTLCWKTNDFSDINYNCGAHTCSPIPKNGKQIKYNDKEIITYHMKWISYDYVVDRYKIFRTKDQENYKLGMGVQSHCTDAEYIRAYLNIKNNGIKIRNI